MPITRLSLDGYGARRAGSFAGRVVVFVPVPLRYLSLELGGGLSQTLLPSGSVLTIETTTTAPTGAPPGNRGVVFQVAGAVVTVWVWDAANTVWRAA